MSYRREREPVDESGVAPVALCLFDVAEVGAQQLLLAGADRSGHRGERAVLRSGVGTRQHAGGGARRLAQAPHVRFHVKLLIHLPILTRGR